MLPCVATRLRCVLVSCGLGGVTLPTIALWGWGDIGTHGMVRPLLARKHHRRYQANQFSVRAGLPLYIDIQFCHLQSKTLQLTVLQAQELVYLLNHHYIFGHPRSHPNTSKRTQRSNAAMQKSFQWSPAVPKSELLGWNVEVSSLCSCFLFCKSNLTGAVK